MEVRRLRSVLSEALRLQEIEEETAFTSPNLALNELAAEADFETLLQHARHLRRSGVEERQLYARLLAGARMPPSRRLAEVLDVLAEESDARVVRWLVFALRNTASSSAVEKLLQLARHPSPEVRFPVPDGLSACADTFDDISDALLALSRDADPDVRWSAAFELGAWWADEKDPEIEQRLSEIAAADPSDEVRQVAQEALRGSS